MYQRAIVLLVEIIIGASALTQAVLGAYGLVTYGLPGLATAWPDPFTRAAHLLLWPFASLGGRAPAQAGPDAVIVAMLCYVCLTFASVGAVNLLSRQPPVAAPPSSNATTRSNC